MKLKSFSIVMAMFLVLVGCQGNVDDGRSNDSENNNIEPTRNIDDNRGNLDTNGNNSRGGLLDNQDTDRTNRNRDGLGDNRDTNRTDQNRNNVGNIDNSNDEYSVSEEASDKIVEELEEIERAHVLTTKNNAYVAAMLDNNDGNTKKDQKDGKAKKNDTKTRDDGDTSDAGDELTDEVKRKISDIVQSVDSDIDNVYVTTNPDFADLTNDYMDQMNDGKPIRGFFDQIGNAIERVFPQDKR